MTIILTVALLLIAGAMLLGKPLQITIYHKYDQPPAPVQPEQPKENDEQDKPVSMDNVIKALNDIMGVNTDEDNYI
jgi:hypothetical protein